MGVNPGNDANIKNLYFGDFLKAVKQQWNQFFSSENNELETKGIVRG
jgi:hypothetical protein